MMRWAWPLSLVIVGLVAIAAQLDRQSRLDPELAPYVPSVFRGFAQEAIVERDIAGGHVAAAISSARALVAQRPIPAEHLLLLARAQLLAGDEVGSLTTAQRAAHRSWRDEATQLLMFRLAIDAGDDAEMGRRLSALLAIQADRELLAEAIPLVVSRPQARQTLVAILATGPRWKQGFDYHAERALAPAHLAALRAEIDAASGVRASN